MAVVAAACGEGRNHGMAQPRKYTFAFTAVVQRVFPEGLCQRIARRRGDRCDAKIRAESLAVTRSSLHPLRRRIVRLVDARRDSSTHHRIGPKRVENVAVELGFRCRADICEFRVRWIWIAAAPEESLESASVCAFAHSRKDDHHQQQEHDTAHVHFGILPWDLHASSAEWNCPYTVRGHAPWSHWQAISTSFDPASLQA